MSLNTRTINSAKLNRSWYYMMSVMIFETILSTRCAKVWVQRATLASTRNIKDAYLPLSSFFFPLGFHNKLVS